MTLNQSFIARLGKLSESQLMAIRIIVTQFEQPFQFKRNENSDLFSECVLRELGDTIRVHHCFSREAFSKDKFEYALERSFILCGQEARLLDKGNPGADIEVDGVRISLKTQADKAIKLDRIHISKWMEMGKGEWTDKPKQLLGLRQRFLKHMEGYARIVVLRRLVVSDDFRYELVEIPKNLLLEENGKYVMQLNSKQMPKPGSYQVFNESGQLKFELYFDAGSERKLQVRNLDKSNCVVHAEWQFSQRLKTEEENALV